MYKIYLYSHVERNDNVFYRLFNINFHKIVNAEFAIFLKFKTIEIIISLHKYYEYYISLHLYMNYDIRFRIECIQIELLYIIIT